MHRLTALAAVLALAANPVFGQGAAPTLTRIGAAAAVHGLVNAQTPGSVGRVIQSGKPLFLNDHVTTDAAGRLQVLLLDETVFTLGPDSDMVLDEFVYDPSNDSGKVTARVTKGLFRFVTGKIARRDPAKMKVKLPVGTIGIRGTQAAGEADEQGSTVVLLGPGDRGNTDEPPGAITFENNGTTRFIGEPGTGVTCRAGQSPSGVQNLGTFVNKTNDKLSSPVDEKAKTAGRADRSATRQSGQETAVAKRDSVIAEDNSVLDRDTSKLLTQAQQDAAQSVPNGLATWDQIRGNLTTGTGVYSGSGVVSCSNCQSQNPHGSLQLLIDFGARTIGGSSAASGSSAIQIHGVSSSLNSDTIEQTISPISFSALSGNAKVTLDNTNLGPVAGGSGDFTGSTISLINENGVTAAVARTDMKFVQSNTLAPVQATGAFGARR